MKTKFNKLWMFLCAAVMLVCSIPAQKLQVFAEETDNLIINGCFDDSDNLEIWSMHKNEAVMTAEKPDTPVAGTITSYGKITGRTSNYQCFAQELTGKVEKGETYYYSFYAMLDAEDYKDAPEAQRTIEVSPHVRSDGRDVYSQGVSGMVTTVLEPGVWTKITGTFTPEWDGELELIALRFLEQGTNYGQGAGVKGTYYITGVTLNTKETETEKVQKDIPDLKDKVSEVMGNDFLVGAAFTESEMKDPELFGLVTKHFNAVTFGNECKPDAIFGYARNPKTETVAFNGEELLVPKLDFSRADRMLNAVNKWNRRHPDEKIVVRGHVLLWHTQTPEWFFHEDYNAANPYVSKELMSKRLEWYIKSVAEHFNGENSEYKDLFYAWDVVNEAVNDAGEDRTDKQNSSWWAVYQSNEYVIDAFRFANKYMPADVDLYYNDYNECVRGKTVGICKLIEQIKAAEGTRIDGMGMQGHYLTGSATPTVEDFLWAARKYAELVDKIQLTEFDLQATPEYIGTDYSRELEYRRLAKRYHELYEAVQTLTDEGVNFEGIIFWGVIDKYSWLQNASFAGGGSDGKRPQVPLLFDDNYQAKLAYWAFADEAEYQRLAAIEVPTPTPKPTATPKPTKAPKPTEAPVQTTEPPEEPTVAPTEAPATDTASSSDAASGIQAIIPILCVLIVAAAAVLIVFFSKRKK